MADLDQLRRAHEDLYDAFESLTAELGDEDWDRPTGCPGWSVRDVVAHVVGLEALLAGDPEPDVELTGDLDHVRDEMGRYMETHVAARRGRSVDELLAELATVADRRRAQLAGIDEVGEEVPTVMGGRGVAARVLPIRVFDLYAHEQDVRRAVGRPGHHAGPAVDVTHDRVLRGLAHVLPEKLHGVDALAVTVTDHPERSFALTLPAGERVAVDDVEPTVALRCDWSTLMALVCGRSDAPPVSELDADGPADLVERTVRALAMTP